MAITGIIAEFNPLHNGHIALIEHARRNLRSTHIVVVMSGDFTQRGVPAMINKYERAKLAIKHGADLVFEMPVVASTSSAETFASTGVCLLGATGVCTHLLFGAEDPEPKYFHIAANQGGDSSMDLHHQINALVKKGETYAKARAIAMEMQESASSILPPSFLLKPNNILGVEYCKAIKSHNLQLTTECIKRGGDHNDTSLLSPQASGSAIREAAAAGKADEAKEAVPDDVMKMIRFNSQFKTLIRSADVSLMLHSKLLAEDDFSVYLDCNEDISNKINNAKDKFVEFENFCTILKTKDVVYSRVSRVLAHILLNIRQDDYLNLNISGFAPYLRILSFSSKGQKLLSSIKEKSSVPMFLSPKEGISQLSMEATKVLERDIYASDLYRVLVTGKSGRVFPTEFTRSFSP